MAIPLALPAKNQNLGGASTEHKNEAEAAEEVVKEATDASNVEAAEEANAGAESGATTAEDEKNRGESTPESGETETAGEEKETGSESAAASEGEHAHETKADTTEDVGTPAESPALDESREETSAVETSAEENNVPESSVEESTVAETTAPESTEAEKNTMIRFHVVDEEGEDIDAKYADVKVVFDSDGILALDDSEKAPVKNIRKLTGTRLFGLLKTYSRNYTYKEATLNGDVIKAIRKTTDEDQHTVYEYTLDGESWTTLEEDAEILLVYCAPEVKGNGHAEYIEDGKIKVVVDMKKELPEGVQLRVQEVTDENQNYDAYMSALNDATKASLSEIQEHSNKNTLLYDIAFIGQDEDGQEYEYQPGEDVSVKVSFLGGQLVNDLGATEASNVVIKHLPIKDEVKENAAREGQRTTADIRELSAEDIQVEDVQKPKVTLDTEAKTATVAEDENEEEKDTESKDEVTFKTDGFSVYAFTDRSNENDFDKLDWTKDFVTLKDKNQTEDKSNTYYFENQLSDADLQKLGGASNIQLEYHYITDDSETFTGGNSNQDNDLTGYKADRALGIAGNFHIVAFGTAYLGTHTNGNVLASQLEAGANFGTNNFGKESSYVYTKYANMNGGSAASTDDILGLGNNSEINLQEDGKSFGIKNQYGNYQKIDRPHIIYKDSVTKKYIDIKNVKSDIETLSNYLANQETTANGSNGTYTIKNPNGVEYLNWTSDEVKKLPTDVFFDGFKSGCHGSIIVNVDMSDMV